MWRLVADVGGTNVRFARAGAEGRLERLARYRTASFVSFAAALDHYLDVNGSEGCASCAVGAAGPVGGDRVLLTNCAWSVAVEDLAARLGGIPVALVNDLEAVAAALPHLADDELLALGPAARAASDRLPLLALNVGTGFGAALAVHRASRWWTLASEAGHMTLGASDAGQLQLLGGPTSIEGVLSGPGVRQLHVRLGGKLSADESEVFSPGSDDAVRHVLSNTFSSLLGRVAGDLALAAGAWGGVFLTGSVATAWARTADIELFRAAFEAKGLMRAQMSRVPTALIVRDHVALFGLAKMDIETPP
jgi:glucokinase